MLVGRPAREEYADCYILVMSDAVFLYEDKSWTPIPLRWGPGFNSQLRNAIEDPAPPTVSPVVLPNLDTYQAANTRALHFLDSRQVDENGLLPTHVCAPAHGVWEAIEKEMLLLSSKLNNAPEDTPEFQLLDAYVVAWLCLVRVNIGNLALVDAGTSPRRIEMAREYIQKMRSVLESVRRFEGHLEEALKGPISPTRLLRNTIDFALR